MTPVNDSGELFRPPILNLAPTSYYRLNIKLMLHNNKISFETRVGCSVVSQCKYRLIKSKLLIQSGANKQEQLEI